jgi:hypothetical protein
MYHLGRSGVLAIALAVVFAATVGAAPAPQPVNPQPAASALKDGLAARLYFGRFTHIDELTAFMQADKGRDSPPLPNLDYGWAAGNVLGTTSSDLVGAHITGLVNFAQPGTYQLQVTSNDGIRLTVGGVKLFEDPEIHGDTPSPPLPVEIATPGWYDLDILYYEKKGTASLRLHWQPPGASGFVAVPASAFKHR